MSEMDCMRMFRFECGRCATCRSRAKAGRGPRKGRLRWLAGLPLFALTFVLVEGACLFEDWQAERRAPALLMNGGPGRPVSEVKPCLCCGGRGIYVVKVSTTSLSGSDKSVRELEDWSCWAHMDEVGATLEEQLHAPLAMTWTGAA